MRHKDCGGEIDDHLSCERCRERLGPRDTYAEPGPGATERVRERYRRLQREDESQASAA